MHYSSGSCETASSQFYLHTVTMIPNINSFGKVTAKIVPFGIPVEANCGEDHHLCESAGPPTPMFDILLADRRHHPAKAIDIWQQPASKRSPPRAAH